jgi:outer membrane protein OmpA-like peptidoglycan-associated protein/tetratricopeptide (TPR) repeat protein
MKIKKLLYCTLLIAFSLQGFAQKAKVAVAEKKYDRFSYFDAIVAYEYIANKGYKDEKMFQKLGNAYYFNAELEKAAKWYGELFTMNQEQEPEYYYRYSQTLKAIGQYDMADKMLEQFNKKSGNDQRAKLFENNKNYLEVIKDNSGRFTIANAGINSEYSDFGSSLFDNNLIFASSRFVGVSKRVFEWTNQAFTNLYSSELTSNENLKAPKPFNKKINSKYHESTPIFTKDGKTMYFTRNNYFDGKEGKDSNKITLLKVYKATFEDGKWNNLKELPFNSNQYSVAHPMLSPDEKTLYFASDMPGSLGKSDLFKVTINEDDTFTTPVNLGSSINTEGRETFPFISEDNELYFASDGRPGLGGLDIFVSKIEKDNNFAEVQNVGSPVNGPQDDFAFLIDSKTRKGFFTSNRDGGQGYDDIYKFTETRKLTCEQVLAGTITDKETTLLLANTKVILFDSKFQYLKESLSDEKGQFSFEVECGKMYYIRAEKLDYETKESTVSIAKINGKTYLSLALEKRIKPFNLGTDLAKSMNIPMIYFDLDKSFVRKDAAFELEKILAIMNQFPAMKVDVRSHTDSRQKSVYNNVLSNRRAKATRDWLIKNGIEASRLTNKGYGETQLVNRCSDGVACTEAEHQANRRSEFIVISME